MSRLLNQKMEEFEGQICRMIHGTLNVIWLDWCYKLDQERMLFYLCWFSIGIWAEYPMKFNWMLFESTFLWCLPLILNAVVNCLFWYRTCSLAFLLWNGGFYSSYIIKFICVLFVTGKMVLYAFCSLKFLSSSFNLILIFFSPTDCSLHSFPAPLFFHPSF